MKPIDTIHVILSDTHTGSNNALFLPTEWQGENTPIIYARGIQVKIRQQFDRFIQEIKAARKGKKIKVIVNGDAIEGNHHNVNDICTTDPLEMADIHIALMAEFQSRINWQRGDELYYVKGTEVHTKDFENYIGRELNAVMNGNSYAFDFLPLETNGVLSWFVHHGAAAGAGANEGNSLRNWLRNIYIDSLKDETRIPDIVYTGHVHNPTYSSYIFRNKMNFKTMHGIILPSWQAKTRYAYMRAPVSVNKIGGVIHEIKADGTICVPYFSIMV